MSKILSSLDVNNIHTSLENYIQTKQVERDKARAHKLEQYFRQIMAQFRTPKTSELQALYPQSPAIKALLAQQGIPLSLFDFYDDTTISSFEQGKLFESCLGKVIDTLFQTHTPVFVGDKQVTSNVVINAKTSTLSRSLKVQVPKEVNKGITKYIKMTLGEAKRQGYNLVYLASASGVVDLQIPNSQLQLTYEPTQFLQNFYNELRGAQITAKSYTDMTTISTGKTGYYRMLSSILPVLGHADKIEAARIYYQIQFKDKKKDVERRQHRAHLTYAYQLLGTGQYSTLSGGMHRLSETNFLVVFDRTAQTIHVRSTKALVWDYVRRGEQSSVARYPVINLLKS